MNRFGFVTRLCAALGLASCQRPPQHGMDGGMISSMKSTTRDERHARHVFLGPRSRRVCAMMGSTDSFNMQGYMAMFQRHREIRRSVEQIENGVRTVTRNRTTRG